MKRFLSKLLALALVLAAPLFPFAVWAAVWSYEQGFEAYTLGSISGQDSWHLTTGTIAAVNTQAYEGTKSIQLTTAGATNGQAERAVTDADTDGSVVYYAVRVDNVSIADNAGIVFLSNNGATGIGVLYMNAPTAGDMSFRLSGGAEPYIQLGDIRANEWYCLGVEFTPSTETLRFSVNGAPFGTSTVANNAFSSVDGIWFLTNNDTAGDLNSYFDNFTKTPGCSLAVAGDGEEYSISIIISLKEEESYGYA